MKRIVPSLSGLLLGAIALTASGAALAPNAPLIEDGPIVVDAQDFEANMLRIPENRRADFRTSYDRVATIVDGIYVTRAVAAKARAQGLDKDPILQRRLQQLQDAMLADAYVQKIEKEAPKVDYELLAREDYKAQANELKKPEQVYIQQIVIGLNGRTKEMAAERAQKVREEAMKPDVDFLALAEKYSDDPDKARNGGDVGYKTATELAEPIRSVVQKMRHKGETSQPVETPLGFHIVRFIDRRPPRPLKFEEVKDTLIKREKEKLQKARVDAIFDEARASKTVVVHRDNVEALVVPLDPEEVKRKAAEATSAPSSAQK